MKQHRQYQKSEKGQSLVELSISLIFIMMVLAAASDLGWALFTMISLRDSAQEAATFGAICPTNTTKIKARLRDSAGSPIDVSQLTDAQINVCVSDPSSSSCGASAVIGNNITVTVTYQHEIVTPLVGTVIGRQQYPLVVTESEPILRLDCSVN